MFFNPSSFSQTAVGVAGDAFEKASPVAQATFDTLSAQDPTILAAGAGTLIAIYLLTPGVFGSIVSGARGFAGEPNV